MLGMAFQSFGKFKQTSLMTKKYSLVIFITFFSNKVSQYSPIQKKKKKVSQYSITGKANRAKVIDILNSRSVRTWNKEKQCHPFKKRELKKTPQESEKEISHRERERERERDASVKQHGDRLPEPFHTLSFNTHHWWRLMDGKE